MFLCEGLILDCTYSVRQFWIADPLYTCTARLIALGDPRNVTDVAGTHLPGYSNINVLSIVFENQVMGLAPRNIHAFFPNLQFYRLSNTQTENIEPGDINRFAALRYYMAQYIPQLTSIGPNMFANNTQLEGIAINVNEIQNIAYNVFDSLNNLSSLHIGSKCIVFGVDRNRPAVLSNLFNIHRSCPPTLQMLNQQLDRRCYCKN